MPLISESRILIIATDGFEEWELFGPREILQKRGAEVVLASPKLDPIQATVHDDPGKTIRPDLTIDQADADDFDALILPGGVRNPDHLRMNVKAIELIKQFARQGKPIAAICHGPWLLVEADLVRGRTATSWPSIRTDLRNAGATVVDQPAVVDGNIVTSRNPQDVEEFTNALIDLVEQAPEVSRNPPAERASRLTSFRISTDWQGISLRTLAMRAVDAQRIETMAGFCAAASLAAAVGFAVFRAGRPGRRLGGHGRRRGPVGACCLSGWRHADLRAGRRSQAFSSADIRNREDRARDRRR